MRRAPLVPLTGVAFVLLLIHGFTVDGKAPDVSDSSAQQIVAHYVDHRERAATETGLLGLAAIALIFFAGHLRTVLREPEATTASSRPSRSSAPRCSPSASASPRR